MGYGHYEHSVTSSICCVLEKLTTKKTCGELSSARTFSVCGSTSQEVDREAWDGTGLAGVEVEAELPTLVMKNDKLQ